MGAVDTARRALAAVAAVGLALTAGWWYGRPEPPPTDPPSLQVVRPTTSVASSEIAVHVSGEVATPGVVVLEVPARVADAVAAAGGATRRARLDALNLAAPVRDGEQVVVPGPEGGVAAVAGETDGRIRINRAGVEELQRLPGVGPVLAERIFAHRTEHGPFGSVEDLLDVPGIGEGKLAALRDVVALP